MHITQDRLEDPLMSSSQDRLVVWGLGLQDPLSGFLVLEEGIGLGL